VGIAVGVADIWVEGYRVTYLQCILILTSVLLVSLILAFGVYRRERSFMRLRYWTSSVQVIVRRNSQLTMIDKQSLVVGDIVLLQEGDVIPVDCLIFSGSLLVDEAHFTNSFQPITKLQSNPFIIGGSKVLRGTGEIFVCTVGENRQTFNKLTVETTKTSIEAKLQHACKSIGLVGIYIALAVFVALVGHQVVTKILLGKEFIVIDTVKLFTEHLIIAVIVMIVAVPEGSLLALSIAWNTALRGMHGIKVKSVNCNLY
jgi:Ca2+-transporting ATPase